MHCEGTLRCYLDLRSPHCRFCENDMGKGKSVNLNSYRSWEYNVHRPYHYDETEVLKNEVEKIRRM